MSSTPDERTPGDQAKQEFERAKGEASRLASGAADVARSRGREQLDGVKRQAADKAERFADAIDSTVEDLESEDGSGTVSNYGHSMADMMRRFAGGLREHEVEEFASQLATFARRSPASFLAGSVALGFGVSRFLKATSQRSADEYRYRADDDYRMDDEEDFDDEYLFDEEDTLDTTLQPSPSPDVTTQSAGSRWPEDQGERPGSASPSQHTTPAASGSTEYSTGATGEPASSRSNPSGSSAGGSGNLSGSDSSRSGSSGSSVGGGSNLGSGPSGDSIPGRDNPRRNQP